MSSKAGVKRAGLPSPISASTAQLPFSLVQQLTPETRISSSRIPLSPGFSVHLAVFVALHSPQGHLDIDLARRKLFESDSAKAIEDSLLTYSQINKEESALWVFCIEQGTSRQGSTELVSRLHDLDLNGLTRKFHDKFCYTELYPCSTTCSTERTPCQRCLRSAPGSPINPSSHGSDMKFESTSLFSSSHCITNGGDCFRRLPASCHLPRIPLRQPLAFFLHAVQYRIINNICENICHLGIAARRYGSGILYSFLNASGKWGEDWDQHWKTHPLIYCHVQVSLLASGILFQPHFRRTHFLPFIHSPHLPSGTPINLLPFSTPAYYLNMYSGSTSALIRQFQSNLVGLGIGSLSSYASSSLLSEKEPFAGSSDSVKFVIAWISVQNKQGEEKGMVVIWPAPLCVSLMTMPTLDSVTKVPINNKGDSDVTISGTSTSTTLFAYDRKPLTHIPELPLALQPSPVPAPATVPVQSRAISPSLFTPVGRTFSAFSREGTPSTPFPPRSATTSTSTHHVLKSNHPLTLGPDDGPPLLHAFSFPPSTREAFRTITVSAGILPANEMRSVAEGVGKFVDFMAKERERERERIKREKEREASAGAQASFPSTSSQAQGVMKGSGVGVGAGVGTPQSPGVIPSISSAVSSIAGVLQTSTGVTGIPLDPTQITSSITLNAQTAPNTALTQIQQPTVPPNHPSYPSPPEEITGKVDPSNPATSAQNASVLQAQAQSSSQPPPVAAGPAPFDPDSFDENMTMDKFMMDLGMSMDFNMGSAAGHHHQEENIKVDFESLGVFTDDDFSFFDDPVPVAANVTTAASAVATGTTASATANAVLQSTSMLETNDEALRSMGIRPPLQEGGISGAFDSTLSASLTPFDKSSPWTTMKQRESRIKSTAPDLLPSSPGDSTSSSAGPATPDIICLSDVQPLESEANPFDPIRFSKRYHSVNAKYARGKFSSVIIEKNKDEDEVSVPQEKPVTVLWRTSYDSLTDPRIEIVKKLIGMKRRLLVQGARADFSRRPFQETRSDWDECVGIADDMSSAMDVDAESERDSDEEDQTLYDFKTGGDGDDSISRPSTPLPSHLPLGPTLLSTQFQHSLLLPLSTNLKPLGAMFTTLDMASPLPNPVPTPVSPAAMAGLTSEKSKNLEAFVRAVAIEVVENSVWESAWHVNTAGHTPRWRQCEEEVEDDASFLSSGWLLEQMTVQSFSSLASSATTFEDVKLEGSKVQLKALEKPMFTVGKADVLVQIAAPALRFWSKLGLTPRSGPKDVVAFVLYEDNGRLLSDVESWLNLVAYRYNAKGYGKHSLGRSGLCSKDGLIPLRYTTFRKTLASLVDSLGTTTSPIIIYVATPSSILSISSHLRQILSSINRVLSSREEDAPPIRFHLVPESLVSFKDDAAYISELETFVDNVYNRIPRPVDRFMSRPFFTQNDKRRKYFEAPSFTLARPSPSHPSLAFQYPPPAFSSMDQHTLLHVGYKLTRCKKWLIAACIDERGEGHDLGVWLAGEENDWKHVVNLVWRFTMDFARRVNVEWRVAITKLGSIGEAELEAWNALVNDELSDHSQLPPMHVSLVCVDDESGWSLLAGQAEEHSSSLQSQKPPSNSGSDPHGKGANAPQGSVPQNHGNAVVQNQGQGQGQLFTSVSTTYVLSSLRLPLPPAMDLDLGAAQFILEDDESSASVSSHLRSSDRHRLLPLLSSALITVPSLSLPSALSGSPGAAPRATFIHLLFTTSFPGSGSTLTRLKTDISRSAEECLDDICRSYHDLAVLTEVRWHFHFHRRRARRNGTELLPLPYHLAALRIVDSSLESLSDMGVEQ